MSCQAYGSAPASLVILPQTITENLIFIDNPGLGLVGSQGLTPSVHPVVGFDTEVDLLAEGGELSAVEHRHGRRPLDLDILLYGTRVFRTNGIEVPRRDILEYAFVLWPLADIAPALRRDANGQRIADLWQAIDQTAKPLWPVSSPMAERASGRLPRLR